MPSLPALVTYQYVSPEAKGTAAGPRMQMPTARHDTRRHATTSLRAELGPAQRSVEALDRQGRSLLALLTKGRVTYSIHPIHSYTSITLLYEIVIGVAQGSRALPHDSHSLRDVRDLLLSSICARRSFTSSCASIAKQQLATAVAPSSVTLSIESTIPLGQD